MSCCGLKERLGPPSCAPARFPSQPQPLHTRRGGMPRSAALASLPSCGHAHCRSVHYQSTRSSSLEYQCAIPEEECAPPSVASVPSMTRHMPRCTSAATVSVT
eukprot:scaffold644_cov126-Isochrysis_galbana.AAC.4